MEAGLLRRRHGSGCGGSLQDMAAGCVLGHGVASGIRPRQVLGGRPVTDRWIILRTAGRNTLGLFDSLAKDGFDVWTPVETKNERVGRSRRRVEIRRSIMPSYVFARESHLLDLLQLAELPVKPRRGRGLRDPAHADFSVLHAFGRIPMVAERHLSELRKIEAKRTVAKRALYSFPRNASARVKGGAFGGLVGVVVRSTPMKTTLCFGKSFPVEIPTSLLDPDEIRIDQIAALKAA